MNTISLYKLSYAIAFSGSVGVGISVADIIAKAVTGRLIVALVLYLVIGIAGWMTMRRAARILGPSTTKQYFGPNISGGWIWWGFMLSVGIVSTIGSVLGWIERGTLGGWFSVILLIIEMGIGYLGLILILRDSSAQRNVNPEVETTSDRQ